MNVFIRFGPYSSRTKYIKNAVNEHIRESAYYKCNFITLNTKRSVTYLIQSIHLAFLTPLHKIATQSNGLHKSIIFIHVIA